MSDVMQSLVVQPEELRKLDLDLKIAWALVRSRMEGSLESEEEVKFRLARILMGLAAQSAAEHDLAAKAAAEWLENRGSDGHQPHESALFANG